MSHPGGRPPLYSDPSTLKSKIDEYFINGVAKKTVIFKSKDGPIPIDIPYPTISGLVRYCGFADRHSFYQYEVNPEFTNTIKYARNRMEEVYEQLLQEGVGAGAIFALKNFGWVDKTEVDSNVNIKSLPEVKIDGKTLDIKVGDSVDGS